MKIEVCINDAVHEYLMNLVAQGYYGEAWDLKMKLIIAFDNSLMWIMGDTLNAGLIG